MEMYFNDTGKLQKHYRVLVGPHKWEMCVCVCVCVCVGMYVLVYVLCLCLSFRMFLNHLFLSESKTQVLFSIYNPSQMVQAMGLRRRWWVVKLNFLYFFA